MCFGGDSGAEEARERQRAKEAKIRSGIEAVNALFGTEEREQQYGEYRQNVFDLNKTSLDRSYEDAQRQLSFGLARNSLGGSSISAYKKSKQLEDYNENIQRVNDLSDSSMNVLKVGDERTRQNLVSSVQTGLDQTNAVNQALTNMQLNYDRAKEINVSKNWDNMFDQWKRKQRGQRYNNYMNSNDDYYSDTFYGN